MGDTDPKSATATENAGPAGGIPGSASRAHPSDGIPLPAHGFDTLDDLPARDGSAVPPGEVITRAAVLLVSAAADRLGLSQDGEPDLDPAAARPLIDALAGLLAASSEALGERHESLVSGLRSLQQAYREAVREPDEPGGGPGERFEQYLA